MLLSIFTLLFLFYNFGPGFPHLIPKSHTVVSDFGPESMWLWSLLASRAVVENFWSLMGLPSCLSSLEEENTTVKYPAWRLNKELKGNEVGFPQLLDTLTYNGLHIFILQQY